jgi:hypothetical protein
MMLLLDNWVLSISKLQSHTLPNLGKAEGLQSTFGKQLLASAQHNQSGWL